MAESESTINPKPIISLMFAVSVGFWASQLAAYANQSDTRLSLDMDGMKSWATLVSGTLFLLDLLCIVWWYARYIYRVQPDASFGTYFLDFIVCSMFALAANSWTKPTPFLIATVFGSFFLVLRFLLLYRSSSASLTDKRILTRAGIFLGIASLVALLALSTLLVWLPKDKTLAFYGHGLPGAFSLVGILLTIGLKNKIDVAVDIYTARHATIAATNLWWPTLPPPNDHQRSRIRQQTKAGLGDFDALFRELGRHDRIHSRVHSETDLRVQSYVLALPSCEEAEQANEIEKKAFMVAASHWLDDLVDGRSEVGIWKRLRKAPPLSDDLEEAEKLFEQIYAPLIKKHTHHQFYSTIVQRIRDSCLFTFNVKYMFLGLNRVAYGALIFSPRLPYEERTAALIKHNDFLKYWNKEKESAFEGKVENILDEILEGGDAGAILLGLTTKTVQEVAMSSENQEMNKGLSILYSILYAPLIYYHNIGEELMNKEMIPLQAFDTDCDVWIPWIRETRELIAGFEGDDRRGIREQQIEMAFRCFEPLLPANIRYQLEDIFVGHAPQGASEAVAKASREGNKPSARRE